MEKKQKTYVATMEEGDFYLLSHVRKNVELHEYPHSLVTSDNLLMLMNSRKS